MGCSFPARALEIPHKKPYVWAIMFNQHMLSRGLLQEVSSEGHDGDVSPAQRRPRLLRRRAQGSTAR